MATCSPKLNLFLILVISAWILFAGCSAPVSIPAKSPEGSTPVCGISTRAQVTRAIDGDTLAVRFSGRGEETVRILGIDTPETEDHGNWGGEFAGIGDPSYLTAWGLKAAEYTGSVAEGKTITLMDDCLAGDRDRYGRILAYVEIDGMDLGARLVSEGYARVYTAESFDRKPQYLSLQSEAQQSGAGLWSRAQAPDGIAGGPVTIKKVQYDAPGEDRADLNGEYIVLASTATVDLNGWTITDNSGTTYTFRHVVITPKSTLTLHIGPGTPTATDLYWNLDNPLLGNDSDAVILRDSSGNVVSAFRWGT